MNYPWQATVQDDQGNAVVNPVVTVWEADGVTLATIYDVTGAVIPNPIMGSLEGFVQFWASEGEYRIEGASGGQDTEVWSWVAGVDMGGVIRYDVAQALTSVEKDQARDNIDAQPSGSYLRYDVQALTPPQRGQAAENIAAVSYDAQTLTSGQQQQARANIAGARRFSSIEGFSLLRGVNYTNTSGGREIIYIQLGSTSSGPFGFHVNGTVVCDGTMTTGSYFYTIELEAGWTFRWEASPEVVSGYMTKAKG